MDTAWIQVFVLTISECLAPAGKTICQEQELQMQFTNLADCELAREHLVALMERSDDVIVNAEKSGCMASAQEHDIYTSPDDVRKQADVDWAAPSSKEPPPPDFTQKSHRLRLDDLSACDEVGGIAPCKIGTIIIEGASEESADVWQRH
jgi:hypothetical protein